MSRRHAPFGLPRGHTHADIHDFPGGTYRWLRGLRDSGWAKAHKRVFVFQHHSTRGTPWQPSPITGFNGAEKRRLRELLGREPFWGVFAGHLHREYDGGAFGVFEASEPPPVGKLRQVETSATARDATVTVVRVDDDGAVEVLRF
ncbi:MAG: hypothetical protein HY553_06045 [Elusimicrobia bacterium]|nr:hypothetical protein [Elusimicrobiota bacterium]